MADVEKIDHPSRQSGPDLVWRHYRRSVVFLSVVLIVYGISCSSRESVLAGLVCAGAAFFARRAFG